VIVYLIISACFSFGHLIYLSVLPRSNEFPAQEIVIAGTQPGREASESRTLRRLSEDSEMIDHSNAGGVDTAEGGDVLASSAAAAAIFARRKGLRTRLRSLMNQVLI
jgi:hypothetical protein